MFQILSTRLRSCYHSIFLTNIFSGNIFSYPPPYLLTALAYLQPPPLSPVIFEDEQTYSARRQGTIGTDDSVHYIDVKIA